LSYFSPDKFVSADMMGFASHFKVEVEKMGRTETTAKYSLKFLMVVRIRVLVVVRYLLNP
jgi:hypothetical protein